MGQKNFFLENLSSTTSTSKGFLAPCQNSKKSNDPIPRKDPFRQKDIQKAGQVLFYWALKATAGGPKNWGQGAVLSIFLQ